MVTLILFIQANCMSKQVIYAYVSVHVRVIVSAPDPFAAVDAWITSQLRENRSSSMRVHLFFI